MARKFYGPSVVRFVRSNDVTRNGESEPPLVYLSSLGYNGKPPYSRKSVPLRGIAASAVENLVGMIQATVFPLLLAIQPAS